MRDEATAQEDVGGDTDGGKEKRPRERCYRSPGGRGVEVREGGDSDGERGGG